jgi:MFS transporter, DHA2 family, multidrug resistance protein
MPRLLAGVGLIVFASSCFMDLHLDADYGAFQLFVPDVIRWIGQALVMTPLSVIAIGVILACALLAVVMLKLEV